MPFPFDAVQVLGKAIGRDPARAVRELWARSAAASAACRAGADRVLSLEARLRGQDQPGSDIVAEQLAALGVPQGAMLLRQSSRSTRDEAVQAAAIASKLGLQRLLVISSAYHVPRARRIFEDVLGPRSVSVHGCMALYALANPRERRLILAGEPNARTMASEGRLERALVGAEASLSMLPGPARWRLESWAGRLWRG